MSEPLPNDSPYLTAAEAARYLRYASVRALYKAIPECGIPACRRGGKTFLFDRRELDAWLRGSARRRRSTPSDLSHVALRVVGSSDRSAVASSVSGRSSALRAPRPVPSGAPADARPGSSVRRASRSCGVSVTPTSTE